MEKKPIIQRHIIINDKKRAVFADIFSLTADEKELLRKMMQEGYVLQEAKFKPPKKKQ